MKQPNRAQGDLGMAEIAKLTNLEWLDLSHTRVGDECVAQFPETDEP